MTILRRLDCLMEPHRVRMLQENSTLTTQASSNSTKQFLQSPDLKDEVLATVSDNQGTQSKMADYFFSDSVDVDALVNAFGAALHAAVRESAGT